MQHKHYHDNFYDFSDPFLTCGYGVNAYFDILQSLSKMFLMMTLFSIPLFYVYGKGGFYINQGIVNKFFIGNFGATTMFAKANRFTARHMEIQCHTGMVLDAKNVQFGIMSKEFQSFMYCHNDVVSEIVEEKGYQDCNKAMNKRKETIFREMVLVKCNKKRNCTLAIDINNLVDPSGNSQNVMKACNEESYLYMQMPCLVPQRKVTHRRIIGLFISCLTVFMFLFISLTLEYLRRVQANKFVDWDIKTVTAADYTVEFAITEKHYEYFEKNYLDKSCPISEIGQFRLCIKTEMEQRLSEFPGLHIDEIRGDLEPVKISMITFAFDNSEIINGLKLRGKYIKKEQWRKL